MTVNSTRRAVLAGAAALPAMSLPASASQTSFPELAARLDAVYARWLEEHGKDVDYLAEIDGLLRQELGVSKFPHPDDPIYDTYVEARTRIVHKLSENDKGASRDALWTSLNREINDLCDEIFDQPTRSLADLSVQLRAFALANAETFLDWDHAEPEDVRKIINVACKFCGVDPLPGAEKYFAEDEEA